MKKLLLFLLVAASLQASAQLPGATTINSRYDWLGGRLKAGILPAYCDTSQYPTNWVPRMAGHYMLDTCGSDKGTLYVKYDGYWQAIVGSGGGGTDTSGYGYLDAVYPLVLTAVGDTARLSIETTSFGGGEIRSDYWVAGEGGTGISGPGEFTDSSFSGHRIVQVVRESDQINPALTPSDGFYLYNGSAILFDPLNPFNEGEKIFVEWAVDSIVTNPPCGTAYVSGGGGSFPAVLVGEYFNHSIKIGGTGSFTLGSIVKPYWMTVTLDVDSVHFTGYPVWDGDTTVAFNILNCSGASYAFTSNTIQITYDKLDAQYFHWKDFVGLTLWNGNKGIRRDPGATVDGWGTYANSVKEICDGETLYMQVTANNKLTLVSLYAGGYQSPVLPPGNPFVVYFHSDGFLHTYENQTDVNSGVAYSALMWVRMIYNAGSIIYQYSADKLTWTTFKTSTGASGCYKVSGDIFYGDNQGGLTEIYKTASIPELIAMSGKTIVFIGDSVTDGADASPNNTNRFSARLSAARGATEDERGESGRAMQGMNCFTLDFANSLVPTFNPGTHTLLTIMLGTNDNLEVNGISTPAAYYTKYLAAVQDAITTKGWPVNRIVIIGLTYIEPAAYGTLVGLCSAEATNAIRTQAYIDQAAAVAATTGVKFVDMHRYMLLQPNIHTWMDADGIHPLNAGHLFIAQVLSTIL